MSRIYSRRCSVLVGKLIKNELKAGLNFITPIYIVTAVLAALLWGLISFTDNIENNSSTFLLIAAVILVGFGVFVGTIVAVINNFNKSMFKDQGYLTFTLPVTSNQLLLTKAFCSFFWIFLSYIINIVLISGAVISTLIHLAKIYGENSIDMLIDVFFGYVSDFASAFSRFPWNSPGEMIASIISIVIFAAIYIFISTIYIVAKIYFSVSLSNTRLFQKFGMYSTIGIYFFILVITNILSSFIDRTVPFSLNIGVEGVLPVFECPPAFTSSSMLTLGTGSLVFPLAATVFFFFMTSWFMKHKINLK